MTDETIEPSLAEMSPGMSGIVSVNDVIDIIDLAIVRLEELGSPPGDVLRLELEDAGKFLSRIQPTGGVTSPDYVMVPKPALDWLLGRGPDASGKYFDHDADSIKSQRGRYWWRSEFRSMIAAAPPSPRSGSGLTPSEHGSSAIAQERDVREVALLAALRNAGWRVAVHNDYRLNETDHTFWLFTHPNGEWVKGEGVTDFIALRNAANAIPATSLAAPVYLHPTTSPSAISEEMRGRIMNEDEDVTAQPTGLSPALRAQEIIIEEIGGNCPVQAEGTIDGKRFYFRARGEHWSLTIHPTAQVNYSLWPDDDAEWRHEEPWGEGEYAAGWMPEYTAREKIAKAAGIYLHEPRGLSASEPPSSGEAVITNPTEVS